MTTNTFSSHRKLLAALVFVAISFLPGCTPAPDPDATTKALVNIVKTDKKYTDWAKIECLQFIVNEQNDKHTDIEMREKHGNGCPGDPDISPVVDRFRIEKATGTILRYQVIEDEYEPVGTLRQ